jgi:hypothetical protein
MSTGVSNLFLKIRPGKKRCHDECQPAKLERLKNNHTISNKSVFPSISR